MFNLSLAAANHVFGWSNVALIAGAALVLFGTLGAFWSGGIRERYADERISGNEAQTASAKADAARANEETAKAQLELERLRAQVSWRTISVADATAIATRLAQQPSVVLLAHPDGDAEATKYMIELGKCFEAARWKVLTQSRNLGSALYTGISIAPPDNDHAELVRAALQTAGIETRRDPLPPAITVMGSLPAAATVTIFVGTKPMMKLNLVPARP